MKKTWMASALAVTLIGGGAVGTIFTAAHAATPTAQKQVDSQDQDKEVNDSSEQGQPDKEVSDKEQQAQLEKAAKITKQQSVDIATKKLPGRVQVAGLEDEDGTVVYNVTIKDSNGVVHEVKVDAVTGKVIKVEQADNENTLVK